MKARKKVKSPLICFHLQVLLLILSLRILALHQLRYVITTIFCLYRMGQMPDSPRKNMAIVTFIWMSEITREQLLSIFSPSNPTLRRRHGVDFGNYSQLSMEPLKSRKCTLNCHSFNAKCLLACGSKTKQCLHFICFRRNVLTLTRIQVMVELAFACMFHFYVF